MEAFADRAAIEPVFHDVKEVWRSGQQQVRSLWANIAAWHVNLWLHKLVELWAWSGNGCRRGPTSVRSDGKPFERSKIPQPTTS